MEDWKKLAKIPQVTLKGADDWEYRCTGYEDIISVEYWDKREGQMVKNHVFTIPTFCAEQLCNELAALAKTAQDAANSDT